jgi:hypothetical protein
MHGETVKLLHDNLLPFTYSFFGSKLVLLPMKRGHKFRKTRVWEAKFFFSDKYYIYMSYCQSQWPRGLRRGSSAARLLRLWV